MNKKRLSVVMAGAMLASSVAPVLAAETTTQKDHKVNNSNKGLLIRDLRNLINSKIFENVKENKELAGHSVHYVTIDGVNETKTQKNVVVGNDYADLAKAINKELAALGVDSTVDGKKDLEPIANAGKKAKTIKVGNVNVTVAINGTQSTSKGTFTLAYAKKFDNTNIADLEKAIQDTETGKVRVWDNGHIEKDGKFYGKTLETVKVPGKFEVSDLKTEYDNFKKAANKNDYKAVYDMKFENDILKVYTRQVDKDNPDGSGRLVLEFKKGDDYVDFTIAVNTQGKELETDYTDSEGKSWITHDIAGFAAKEDKKVQLIEGKDIEDKELYVVTITDVDNEVKVALSDLYDGLFLTEKGEELLNTLKEYDAEKYTVVENRIDSEANGLYSFTIELEKTINKEKIKNTVVITSNNLSKLEFFKKGIRLQDINHHDSGVRKFPVQKLVGATRHETAVKVARENADIKTVAENGNIVLVNSDSLVDGLAAAPLAASVINEREGVTPSITNKKKNYVAPILLTNRDGLDKVTKDYIKEVVAHQRVGNLDKVTVYLVGGEAVISKAVENDLKEAGLRVVRAGGKDREATSLRVAELITKDTKAKFDSAFLVGADGAPDAMSVASVAADTKLSSTDNKITPIIVESVHGISEETIEFLKGYKVDTGKNVTIVGGEKVVSAATEATLKAELKGKKVDRLAGANRKETNAKVMSTFYGPGSLSHILVSKDGIAKEGELIDALTATSIAAKYHTPIVLGTNELTKSQIEAIEDATNRDADKYVYQIGGNVAESVVRTIADRLSLSR